MKNNLGTNILLDLAALGFGVGFYVAGSLTGVLVMFVGAMFFLILADVIKHMLWCHVERLEQSVADLEKKQWGKARISRSIVAPVYPMEED